MVTWEEFEKVDMGVGTVLRAEVNENAIKPSFKFEIDFGELGIKKSSAQLTKLYKAEELIGKQIIAVVNFPPKQVAEVMSKVLILGIVQGEEVIILQPERRAVNGKRVA